MSKAQLTQNINNYHLNLSFPGNTIEQVALCTAFRRMDGDWPYDVDDNGVIVADKSDKCSDCGATIYERPRFTMQHLLNGMKQFNAKVKVKLWACGDKCTARKETKSKVVDFVPH